MDNINNANTVKCSVIRLGVVTDVQESSVVIEVNGKSIAIARDKIAAEAAAGDVVRWDGQLWIKQEDHRKSGHNPRLGDET
ncbi:hypothetical protein A8990_12294 [Paenibacillus taihuensis]|uniref:DUF3006 family protein n=1 Tax=Paenibacillus taihuensis TaxID=1156355 RepID=A0A3D9RJT5_9BACL|nr:hypothetical protein [Paenibacillus taihuensis]REE80140.1 hypothetical protein A8990_12294 [Paenibacillus taihuensis]